jgi:hypothetical protein
MITNQVPAPKGAVSCPGDSKAKPQRGLVRVVLLKFLFRSASPCGPSWPPELLDSNGPPVLCLWSPAQQVFEVGLSLDYS